MPIFLAFSDQKTSQNEKLYEACLKGFQASRDALVAQKVRLKDEIKKEELDVTDATITEVSQLKTNEQNDATLLKGLTILKNNLWIKSKKALATYPNFKTELKNQNIEDHINFTLDTEALNPTISSVEIDYKEKKISLNINPAVLSFIDKSTDSQKRKLNQLIYDEVAKINNHSGETVGREKGLFVVDLSGLQGAKSLLKLSLKEVAQQRIDSLKRTLTSRWNRSSDALSSENYKVLTWNKFNELDKQDRQFSMAIYSPLLEKRC